MLCYVFFNDTATTEIYTLSLHDALPISMLTLPICSWMLSTFSIKVFSILIVLVLNSWSDDSKISAISERSEEHTSELQSRQYIVCRLLLEKKMTHISTLYAMRGGTRC